MDENISEILKAIGAEEKRPLPPRVLVALQFGKSDDNFYYWALASENIEPGDRVVVPVKGSYSIPTVVGVYPDTVDFAHLATAWVITKIDPKPTMDIAVEYLKCQDK